MDRLFIFSDWIWIIKYIYQTRIQNIDSLKYLTILILTKYFIVFLVP